MSRDNVFDEGEIRSSGVFRVANKLHVTTREHVIRNELLFRKGDVYDSATVAESERVLRNRQLFRELSVDTAHIGDRFAVIVHTRDGWSTKPKFKFAVASDGTSTVTVGINEINLVGLGNQLYVAYEKQVDRDGLNLTADFRRLFGSNLDVSGNYAGLSDGRNGNWVFGVPFRSHDTDFLVEYQGWAASQEILQFFRQDSEVLDTTIYRRTAFINNGVGGLALEAHPSRYLRLVGTASLRREEYVLEEFKDTEVPDTVTGTVGVFGEYTRAGFLNVRRFNGFGEEDLDLSTTVRVTVNLVPKVFGWERTGIGPGLSATATLPLGSAFLWGAVDANGVFDSAGLDSGRVVMNLAFGVKPHPRHSISLQVQGGVLENPAPGQEFDLGFEYPPRSWEPHSFVGTREFWASFEHRWFVWDALLNLIGVGFAGFFDYGGAWYPGQSSRFGGNVGVGLRFGSALSTIARTGRLDVGYRFGEDIVGSRWTLTFGAGFVFPKRDVPVISYTAVAPE